MNILLVPVKSACTAAKKIPLPLPTTFNYSNVELKLYTWTPPRHTYTSHLLTVSNAYLSHFGSPRVFHCIPYPSPQIAQPRVTEILFFGLFFLPLFLLQIALQGKNIEGILHSVARLYRITLLYTINPICTQIDNLIYMSSKRKDF